MSSDKASDLICVRRRNGKAWGHITSIILDREIGLPIAAMVLVARTQLIERVPWTYLTQTTHEYRLKVGVGELALITVDKMGGAAPKASSASASHPNDKYASIMIWHDRMDWLIKKTPDGYHTGPLDSDTWISGPPPGMTEEDLDLLFPSSRTSDGSNLQ
jgi:hypothetical protein